VSLDAMYDPAPEAHDAVRRRAGLRYYAAVGIGGDLWGQLRTWSWRSIRARPDREKYVRAAEPGGAPVLLMVAPHWRGIISGRVGTHMPRAESLRVISTVPSLSEPAVRAEWSAS